MPTGFSGSVRRVFSKAGWLSRLRTWRLRHRAIKIPKHVPKNWEVEYRYEDDGRFTEFDFVEAGVPSYCGFRRIHRLSYLDLSFIRRKRTYDKQGCRNLLHCFRHHYFGDVCLTKRRCERFFSKRRNFLRSD